MFEAPVMETSYLVELQQRYHQKARKAVVSMLREGVEVDFEAVVAAALQQPMTSLADSRTG